MKIAVFSPVYYPEVLGGGEYSTKIMVDGLVNRGHSVEVFCTSMEKRDEVVSGALVHRSYLSGTSEIYYGIMNPDTSVRIGILEKMSLKYSEYFYSRSWVRRFTELLSKGDYDIVYCAAPLSLAGRNCLWRAAHNLSLPIVHALRSPDLYTTSSKVLINLLLTHINKRAAEKYITAFISPSHFMINEHRRRGIASERMVVIPNAVDCNFSGLGDVSPALKRKEILFAGHVREEKGIITLCKAISQLNGLVNLRIVGSGELVDWARQQPYVQCDAAMNQTDLYKLMSGANAVVLPSEWDEAFGRVLIESIACGTIGIGSNRGGIPEVLNGDERFIFKAGDVDELVKAIERVCGFSRVEYSDALRDQRKWVLQNCTVDANVAHFESLFSSLICR